MAEEKNEPHPEKFRFDINPSLTDISACESLSRKLRSSHGRRHTADGTRQTADLLSDEELTALQWALIANPESGDLIRGSGGLRKLRWAGSGRGKRGGLRVIYYWHVSGSVILLLLAYPKNEQENLSTDQLKILKSIIENEFP